MSEKKFDFSTVIDRHGTWCTQWDFVADRFGRADLLPFTISDMDFATAPCVITAMQQRLAHGVLGYSRWKNDDFLGAIEHWLASRFHTAIDTQALVYGPSVIWMIAELIRQWSHPGDAVVVHTPAYDAFYKTLASNQRELLAVPLTPDETGWQCDMARLEAALARPQSKILLLCSPHNPTGKVWTEQELHTMATLCERHNVKVISDEIHMDMVWSTQPHIPWARVARGPWALFSSASKSFNIPGLTGAWGLIDDTPSRERWLNALKDSNGLSSPAVLSIVAHIAAYREGADWLDALRGYLRANLAYVASTLNGAFPALRWQIPASTYLAWIDLRPLMIDDTALHVALIEQQKIAMMRGDTYGPEGRGFLRLNVGCPRLKLERGVHGLIAALQSLT
ncbi:MalY/PatB family protein [Kosakonia sp. BK9b]|uniref:MalY/PatB family protein n=1 Tax=Kosakonia sp. TaxID=1916651 RepID=UPI0028A229A0|nr:MalY/PatB family protein [Kosakonia sp.]